MNTSEKIKNFWESLPTWSRGVTIVLSIGIVGYAGYTIYQNSKTKKEEQKLLEDQIQASKELDELANNGIKPTLTETDFKQLIDTILTQFKGCDPSFNSFGIFHDPKNIKKAKIKSYYSDSGQVIYNFVDTIQNDADFLAMVGIWGKQTYQDCFEGLGVPPTTATFTAAVNKELDSKEIVALNTLLSSKGITKRFY